MGIFPIIFPIIFLAFPKNAVIPRVSRPIRCGYLYTRQIEVKIVEKREVQV